MRASGCKHPGVVNHDYRFPVETVNRMCLKCGVHWFGPTGLAQEYSRAEWEAWINEEK